MIKKIKKAWYKIIGNSEGLMREYIRYYSENGMKIGNNVRLFSHNLTSEPYLVEIGDDVTISTNVNFITHDNSVIKLYNDATDIFGKIKIGNNCFIGANTIILPGVTIGDNVIIGAGSVVTRSFKDSNIIIAGNPAKCIGNTKDLSEKVKPYVFNMRNINQQDKKDILSKETDKLIER